MPDITGGAIIGGASLLGNLASGIFGSKASSKAADAQTQAAEQNNILQKYIYDQNMARYQADKDKQVSYGNVYEKNTGSYQDALNQYMNRLDTRESYLDPYLSAGASGVAGYQNLLNDPSQITQNPGYQFRLGEGTKALERGAAARSGSLGGAAQKALARYGQDYASGEYNQSLKNYLPMIQAGQTGISQMQGLEGLYSNALNQWGNAGQNYMNLANMYGNNANALVNSGTNYANAANANNTYGANASATGYINQANALTGGLQSGMNNALLGYYMGNYNPQSYYGGGVSGGNLAFG